jgi:hypothetical protein
VLPVQLIHVAPALEAQLEGATLDVTFGELTATQEKLAQPVASKTPLLGTSAQVPLDLDQADESVYGTHGFRVALRTAGSTKFSIDLSLAAVQDLSSPRDLPTSYYRVASNYALLLLGDPSVPVGAADAGVNPERRRVHLLAVPVLDPSQADAGGPGDAGPDGGGS